MSSLAKIPIMKPFLRPGTSRLDQPRVVRFAIGMLAVFGSAFIVGDLVAHETWRYLALFGAVVLALCWPFEIALGTYAFTVPFNSVTALGNTSGSTTLNWVLGALAGMALLSVGIIGKRLRWPPRTALWGALLVGWALLSTLWAMQARSSEHWIPTALSLALLYIVASSWKLTERQFSILTKLIIIGGCLAAGFTVYQYLRGVTWTTTFMGTTTRGSLVVEGREANPNSLGTDLLLPFSLAVAWFFSARRSLSWLIGFGAACLIIAAVFVTQSRGSLLSAGIIIAVFFLRLQKKRRMLLLLIAMLATTLAMPSTFFSRIQSSVRDAGSGRLEIWSVGMQLVKHHGITGVGLANFPVVYNNYAGQAGRFVGFGRGAHNIYLEIDVELGIIGMILLVGALISHIRTVRSLPAVRSPNMQFLALEAACWAMVVAGLFEAIAWNKSFWLTWTLCLMAAQAYRRTSESPVPDPDAERFWEAELAERQEAVGR